MIRSPTSAIASTCPSRTSGVKFAGFALTSMLCATVAELAAVPGSTTPATSSKQHASAPTTPR
jgi:hypothetical protein